MRLAHPRSRIDRVLHAADPHHVAALLVVRIRIEEIVGDILEDRLDRLAVIFVDGHVGIRDRGQVHQVFHRDRLPWEQRRAPAKARGECDLGVLSAMRPSRIS